MMKTLLQAKLHGVTVTSAFLEYEESCGIDERLLDVSGMLPNQKIDIDNVSNGERFATYSIKAPRDSGEVSLNGAAARKAAIGDPLIICAYSSCEPEEIMEHEPIVVKVGKNNVIMRVNGEPATVTSSLEDA